MSQGSTGCVFFLRARIGAFAFAFATKSGAIGGLSESLEITITDRSAAMERDGCRRSEDALEISSVRDDNLPRCLGISDKSLACGTCGSGVWCRSTVNGIGECRLLEVAFCCWLASDEESDNSLL